SKERNKRHPGYAVSLETVCRRADTVARIVPGAIGDHARVLRVVFGQLEDDLHQVGADIGNLGENAAADAEGARAQRFADGEADEAGSNQVRWQETENANHEEQLDAD